MVDSLSRSERTDRGQAVILGALFVALLSVTMLTIYQASIIPAHNAEVELNHREQVTDQFQHTRDTLHRVSRIGGQRTISLDLGPDYPPRIVALNPPVPAGELETTTQGEISLTVDGNAANLSTACGYGGTTVPTHDLAYSVDYRALQTSPGLAYSHSALYQTTRTGQSLVSDQQLLVTNQTIALVPLSGNYSRTSTQTASVKLVSGPDDHMTVNGSDSVRLTIPSRMNASLWRDLLADQPHVQQVSDTGDHDVTISLEPNHTYTVACYPTGVGQAPPTGVEPAVNTST